MVNTVLDLDKRIDLNQSRKIDNVSSSKHLSLSEKIHYYFAIFFTQNTDNYRCQRDKHLLTPYKEFEIDKDGKEIWFLYGYCKKCNYRSPLFTNVDPLEYTNNALPMMNFKILQ